MNVFFRYKVSILSLCFLLGLISCIEPVSQVPKKRPLLSFEKASCKLPPNLPSTEISASDLPKGRCLMSQPLGEPPPQGGIKTYAPEEIYHGVYTPKNGDNIAIVGAPQGLCEYGVVLESYPRNLEKCCIPCETAEKCGYFIKERGQKICLHHESFQCSGESCAPQCKPFGLKTKQRYRFIGRIEFPKNSVYPILHVTSYCKANR